MAYKRNSPQSVVEGGTGASTFTDGAVLLGSGTGAITALDVTAKGSILVGDGTTDPVALAVGANDHVLTADSVEASGLKWAASGGGGGGDYVLISSATASSSTSIDFEGLDDTYNSYVVVMSGVVPETDARDFRMRIGTGATPTYQTGGSDYGYSTYATSTGIIGAQDNTNSFIPISINSSDQRMGNGTNEYYYSRLHVYDPANTAKTTGIDFIASHFKDSGDQSVVFGQGKYKSNTAVTALRFYISTDTILSGEFRLYGLSDS